ncbi:hypothetical protein ES703_120564 [subsurface metagenome]
MSLPMLTESDDVSPSESFTVSVAMILPSSVCWTVSGSSGDASLLLLPLSLVSLLSPRSSCLIDRYWATLTSPSDSIATANATLPLNGPPDTVPITRPSALTVR